MDKKDGGTIDLESLRGILKDEQQGAQMEGPLTDEELASLSEHCCYPDGILDRVIAELTARRARDAEVEVLVEALKKAAYHLASIGFPVDRNGRYDKDGEWTFAAAVPRAVDAGEVATAFHTINAALAPFTGATHDRD